MRTETPPTIRLADYTPPAWRAETVEMTFHLHPTETRVRTTIRFEPWPGMAKGDLVLDGGELTTLSAEIDGNSVPLPDAGAERLTVVAADLPDSGFVWTAETQINPEANTSLEGLYMSKGMYCTQCEAEGFRKITWYQDRPDVMATFSVRIEGDLPELLSNGNPTASRSGFAEWHDPHPKPAYLFALVAGDLVSFDDSFTTASGREVTLRILVRAGDEDRCAYAMDALKRSMRWDEEVYGREYDLDIFHVVAVDDFNMGAMENKGLNIFNSKYVLASPETATDRDYALIEGIIAHEYFHNWTGNRITCRDWFQLSLKEGLTVFRDQQFSADMRSEAVQRISDVSGLRGSQFREDQGPLAHPVRPEEYIEINNFYTSTVYEKGAEVIRMLRLLVGVDGYKAALDLYFERHDGEAATIEDWLKVFEDATGRDLSQFKLWYRQAGTPRIQAEEDWADGRLTLTLSQTVPPTPGQPKKDPMVIPVAYGFVGKDGAEIGAGGVLELTDTRQSWSFDLPERPVVSLLRGFSAPVVLDQTLSDADRAHLLAHDSDPFCRWEAGQRLAMDTLKAMTDGAAPNPALLTAMRRLATDESADPAFRAQALDLPSVDEIAAEIAEAGRVPDPDALFAAVETCSEALAKEMAPDLPGLYAAMAVPGAYSPDAESAGKRSLRATALDLLTRLEADGATAREQFAAADNMTERLSALGLLVNEGLAEDALQSFHRDWKDNPNVLDKWFSVQSSQTPPNAALRTVQTLMAHPDFTWKTPNRFRSLIGAYAFGNFTGFHRADGGGYALLADWILKLDPVNPQTAARMTTAYESWRWFDKTRQAHAKDALSRIAGQANLSKDCREMVERIQSAS